MDKEYFDTLIENISGFLQEYYEEKKKDNSDFNKGRVMGMYYIADSIKDMIQIQNDVKDENNYEDFIKLVEKIEKDYE